MALNARICGHQKRQESTPIVDCRLSHGQEMKKKACFFAKVRDRKVLERVEFYAQDIQILEELGFDVQIATRPLQLRPADLYFVWWWTWAFCPVAFARLLGRPVIVTGVFDLWAMDARTYGHRKLMEFALRQADANVFISEMECRQVPEHFQVRHPQYVPLGVDTEVYRPNRADRRDVVLSVGWLEESNAIRKGMPEVIRAASIIHRDHPEVRFVIAGEKGSYYPALQELAKELGADSYVEFPGAITAERKIELMQSSKVYLQPTHFEGFGLAIMEAMSCGAPVVTCPFGAVPEVVGNAGILVPSGSPDAVAGAVIDLLQDREKRQYLGEQARLRALNMFSFERRKMGIKVILGGVL